MTNETEKEFLEELRALFKKYSVTLDSYDNYDGNYDGDENFCGTEFTLRGNNISIAVKDLESALRKACAGCIA